MASGFGHRTPLGRCYPVYMVRRHHEKTPPQNTAAPRRTNRKLPGRHRIRMFYLWPRERTREWLDKKPFEVTAMLREQSQFSDILLRKPPHPNAQMTVLQAASPRVIPPGLEGKAHWKNPGTRKL